LPRPGEQLRGEVSACQKALADLGRIAGESVRLGLAERRSRLEERQVGLIERALVMALEASGLDLEGRDAACKVLARELRAAAEPLDLRCHVFVRRCASTQSNPGQP
jgi:hypothetical protein